MKRAMSPRGAPAAPSITKTDIGGAHGLPSRIAALTVALVRITATAAIAFTHMRPAIAPAPARIATALAPLMTTRPAIATAHAPTTTRLAIGTAPAPPTTTRLAIATALAPP